MLDFQFHNPAKIIYGTNSLDALGESLPQLGSKILLHYGQNSIKKSGLYDQIIHILEDSNIEYVELGGVKPNPLYDLVETGITLCRNEKVEGILAVGGGSVIDSAKAIAAGVVYEGNLEEAFYHSLPVSKALPLGCVLTIPAAGSESSKSSVVTIMDGKHKRSINSSALIPQFAIINPAWFTSLRADQAAAGISDIFSHLLERYFTQTTQVDFTDRLLEATMRTIIHYGPLVVNDVTNIDAWSEIGFAGTLAHNGLLGVGRQEDWASHRIEHELTARYDIPHGLGLAIVFPAWMKYVSNANLQRFEQFARRVFDVDYAYDNQALTIQKGIERYEQFLKDMYLPIRLHEAGIFEDAFNDLVENAFEARKDSFGNFMKITREDMLEILKLAK